MSLTTPTILNFDCLDSTNTYIAAHCSELPHGAVINARSQTAGRGQRGNSWEAEAGKNLTFSILLRPGQIPAAETFAVSMIVALAIADAVQEAIDGREVRIKWPNDIYVDDLKICGILIENSFMGSRLDSAIIGIGINVNQQKFVSDAPNPVSMTNLTGKTYDLDTQLDDVAVRILDRLEDYISAGQPLDNLTAEYRARQWRGTGKYQWIDNLTGETLTAAIASIAPTGHITLDTTPPRTYAFKELSPVM